MTKTVNGVYQNEDQLKNTWDELINSGIFREDIHDDRENRTLKVKVPAETVREVEEVFERHGLSRSS